MRALKLAAAIFLGLALPAAAFAQTTSSNAQISALLSEIALLQSQISSAGSGSQTTAPASSGAASTPASAPTGISCPDLTQTLTIGSSGAQVIALQTFLAQQGLFSSSITGYFGMLTEGSVSLWQEKNGVVAGGDANSTGLGVVGPKTRAAISAMCGGVTQSQCLDVQPPAAACSTGWEPVLGANGCATYFQCVVPLPNSTQSSTSVSGTATSSAPAACPAVAKPVCTGTVEAYQTNANGCVTSYICEL